MIGITNEAVLERAMGAGPEFPVGTQYAYSNTGYTLLALIVAIVSGQLRVEPLNQNHNFVATAALYAVPPSACASYRAQAGLAMPGFFPREFVGVNGPEKLFRRVVA